MNAITQTQDQAAPAARTAERVFDLDAFDRITANLGFDTDYKRARQMRLSGSTISRIRAGHSKPGEKFIEHLDLIGVGYDQVFPRQKVRA